MPRNSRNTPVSRKRSCANCRATKTRCSLTLPACTRCTFRRLDCRYGPEAQEPELDPSGTWTKDTGECSLDDVEPSSSITGQEALQTVFSIRQEQLNVFKQASSNSEFDIQNEREMNVNWSTVDVGLNQGGDLADTDKLNSVLDFAASESGKGPEASTFQQSSSFNDRAPNLSDSSAAFDSVRVEGILHDNTFSNLQGLGNITSTSAANWSISMDGQKAHSNLLTPKISRTVGSFLNTKHLLSIFSRYPQAVCEKSSLPPFIHPRYPTKEQDGKFPNDKAPSELPDPVAICASLVHMHHFRSSASVKYVWKTIAAEQQRLYSEFRDYDKWRLLSALQAITIYLLMQMSEEEHDDEIAFMLVVTMGEISAKLFAENGYYSISELSGNFPDWDDWVFAESCRRTMLLLFIVERLLDINIDVTPPTNCTGFDSVPLPCSERLWKAETRASWEAAYKDYLAKRKGSGLLKYGTLRQSQQLETGAVDKACLEDLETWCTEVDAFGTIVMTVARGI